MIGPPTLFTVRLTELWPDHTFSQLAELLGLSRTTVRARAANLGLRPKRLQRLGRTEPPASAWIEAVTYEASKAGLKPSLVLAGCRYREFAFARARAFKTVLDDHPNCSIAGLGRVSGFDHTTILWSLKRLSGIGHNEIRGKTGVASFRLPKPRLPRDASIIGISDGHCD